jgi:hypothetical protein
VSRALSDVAPSMYEQDPCGENETRPSPRSESTKVEIISPVARAARIDDIDMDGWKRRDPGKLRGTTRTRKLREGRSAPRCARRAAHARQGSKCKTESDVMTAQGHRLAKVACTLTTLVGGEPPRRWLKSRILRTAESSMTGANTIKREQNHA